MAPGFSGVMGLFSQPKRPPPPDSLGAGAAAGSAEGVGAAVG